MFVTAYDKYAVAAFEQGAVDYVMKPVTPARLVETVNLARSMGAKDVYVAVTHGVYTGPAIERIAALDVTQVASTNTVLVSEEKVKASNGKLAVLDVSPLFANAIANIHTGESVSTLFT